MPARNGSCGFQAPAEKGLFKDSLRGEFPDHEPMYFGVRARNVCDQPVIDYGHKESKNGMAITAAVKPTNRRRLPQRCEIQPIPNAQAPTRNATKGAEGARKYSARALMTITAAAAYRP